MAKSQTIFALSTYFAPSALAIIRISGDRSKAVLNKLCKNSNVKPRYAYFKEISDSQKQPIDKCIIIFYKSPESFTGEDLLEIHTHGSLAVIKRLLEELTNVENQLNSNQIENAKSDLNWLIHNLELNLEVDNSNLNK